MSTVPQTVNQAPPPPRPAHGGPAAPPPRRGPLPLDLPIIHHLKNKRVVLASASPRRRALLAQLGLVNIEVVPSEFAEDLAKDSVTPYEYVALTAQEKCLSVYKALLKANEERKARADEDGERTDDEEEDEEKYEEGQEVTDEKVKQEEGEAEDEDYDDDAQQVRGDHELNELLAKHEAAAASGKSGNTRSKRGNSGSAKRSASAIRRRDPELVIAADTVIATRGGQILEKPRSEEEHKRMLRHLRDTRFHSVLTAVCCIAPRRDAAYPGYSIDVHTEESIVYFAKESDGMLDSVIDSYVRTREGCDKAGGYAVQGVGGLLLVEKIEGSFDNVVGLPVRRFLQVAEKVLFQQEEYDHDEEDNHLEVCGGGFVNIC